MIIKNTGDESISIGFINQGVTLDVGQTYEVPETIVENPFFQDYENIGVLTIISYDSDPTRIAVKQEMDVVSNDLDSRVTSLETSIFSSGDQNFNLTHWGVGSNIQLPAYHDEGFVSEKPVVFTGYITRAYIQASSVVSSGSISVKLTKESTLISAEDFILTLGVGEKEKLIEIPSGVLDYMYTKNNKLGAEVTSVGLLPVGLHIFLSYLFTKA